MFGSILLLLALVVSCAHNNPTQTQNNVPLTATLSSIQANIFTPKCVNAGCHPGGGAPMSLANAQSYGALVNMSSAYAGVPRVTPGNVQRSVLWLKVAGANGFGARMPTGAQPLSQAETDTIAAWINAGARNN